MRHGQGIYFDADGTRTEGQWENGIEKKNMLNTLKRGEQMSQDLLNEDNTKNKRQKTE